MLTIIFTIIYHVLFALSVSMTLNTIWQWVTDQARSDPCFSNKQWIAPILITATYLVFAHFGLNWITKAIEDYLLIVGIVVIAFGLLGTRGRPIVRDSFILLGLVGLIPLTILYCALHFFNILKFNIISTLTSIVFSTVVFFVVAGAYWAVIELKSWISEKRLASERKRMCDIDPNLIPNEMLQWGLAVINHPQYKHYFYKKENENKIYFKSNVKNLCSIGRADREKLSQTDISETIDRLQLFDSDEKFGSWSNSKGVTFTDLAKTCRYCHFQVCPHALLAVLTSWHTDGILNDKLSKKTKDPDFCDFNWDPIGGLENASDSDLQMAKKLLDKNLIYVHQLKMSKGEKDAPKIRISTKLFCDEFNKIDDIGRDDAINMKTRATRSIGERDKICDKKCKISQHCEYCESSCPISLAGYMYYLIKSGRENEVIDVLERINEQN